MRDCDYASTNLQVFTFTRVKNLSTQMDIPAWINVLERYYPRKL